MQLFALFEWDGQRFLAVRYVGFQGDLLPALAFQYRTGFHVPHTGHTTLGVYEVTLPVTGFDGPRGPGFTSGHGVLLQSVGSG